ncbi:origin of replication complex subunit 1A-like [Senna tora]|uniref:Origin recognition complex subunit 1 n=1 Tax=Senna tora TaxID=362788 RepID=A0A834TNM6_9FABA|nr:origin of replication complex subunit 1A-like [Senna tora]
MAETPRKSLRSPSKCKPSTSLSPVTPQSLTPRRSTRRNSLAFEFISPQKPLDHIDKVFEHSLKSPKKGKTMESVDLKRSRRSIDYSTRGENLKRRNGKVSVEVFIAPASPYQSESKKRKRVDERTVVTRAMAAKNGKSQKGQKNNRLPKKRVYYKKVIYDGGEFGVGDAVYVKRREDTESDNDDPEVEECRLCFSSGNDIMIECDDCLGGFHLKCLTPPLKEVPDGDWICGFCEARKMGRDVNCPMPPQGKKLVRTFREKLLSSDLWAAHIESIWKEVDGSYWCRVRWYVIPEETAVGRQPHNLRRELYRTNDFADIEMESVLRHCFVKTPKEFAKANNDGDDIFFCEYEYDIHWHSFKRLAEIDNDKEDGEVSDSDEDWNLCNEADSDTDDDVEYEDENIKNSQCHSSATHALAANLRKGQFFGLQKIGTKKIPQFVRTHKQTDLERAKAMLLLASLPKFLPCRNKEMEEITSFIKGAICDDQCLGRCLYIHGVPGTGKTMSVLSVMKNLRSEVDAGTIRPYCFVEINGLKLASPENIYKVIYEALNGHRVSWKKALHLLNERFVEGKKTGEEADRPCILLIDELDLLVTRNQSVLYNILDWPTKPHSKLIVIGIANTMDLPEKLLPRISSRMGIQRLCFGPYNYQQLQEIISSRLKGVDVFEKQAIEFASRKVAAISGDARRALEICRRAAEIADYRIKKLTANPDLAAAGKELVAMADIEAAIQEMFQAPHIQVMKSCSSLSKIFLTAMVHELYKTGMGETTFEKLAMTVSCLCTSNGEVFPGYDTLLQVGSSPGLAKLLPWLPSTLLSPTLSLSSLARTLSASLASEGEGEEEEEEE